MSKLALSPCEQILDRHTSPDLQLQTPPYTLKLYCVHCRVLSFVKRFEETACMGAFACINQFIYSLYTVCAQLDSDLFNTIQCRYHITKYSTTFTSKSLFYEGQFPLYRFHMNEDKSSECSTPDSGYTSRCSSLQGSP